MAERDPGQDPGLWDDADGDGAPTVAAELAGEAGQESGHDPALAVAARHALHDEELIAEFAGGILEAGPETDRAQLLIARCTACRDLHRDIAAIGLVLRAAGTAADVGARMAAPRDFRLTPEMAAELHPGPWLRRAAASAAPTRLRERLGLALATFGRPLGASLATFGVVGLLVGVVGFGGVAYLPFGASSGAGPAATERTTSIDGPRESVLDSELQPLATNGRIETDPPPGGTDMSGAGGAAPWILGGSAIVLVLGVLLIVLATRQPKRGEPSTG